jgi:hypothetical protein
MEMAAAASRNLKRTCMMTIQSESARFRPNDGTGAIFALDRPLRKSGPPPVALGSRELLI